MIPQSSRQLSVKKLVLFLALVVALGAGTALFLTRNTPVSNAGLKASDLPALIPTRAFFADPRAASDYVASSDGRYVILEQASVLGRKRVVRDVESGEEIGSFPFDIGFIRWHPEKPLVRFVHEGQDWEADPFNPEQERWRRTTPVRLSGGWVKNQIATDAEMSVLTWGKENRNSPGHMWLVSQDGLDAKKIAEGNEKSRFWVFDDNSEPVLRLDSLDDSTDRLFTQTDTGWEPLIDINLNDAFYPLGRVQEDGKVIVRSALGRDKAAIVSFDTKTGEEEVLIENPQTDVGWAVHLTLKGEPDVVRLGPDTWDRVALTERGEVFLEILAQFPQPVTLGSTAATASGRYVTQAISPRGQSYIYLLIDLQDRSFVKLGEFHFRRFKDRLVEDQATSFAARDGTEIPAVLTMPRSPGGPIPFVVYIHGGPAGHVGLGYDHFTQFLVNRGYGVLSVNFRGSSGFGKTFQAKGFRAFGRAMQDDIADAARWLVDEGLADPDALVAMGASYGGFAAAMAMTRDPGLFNAAVVEFPMLDVAFQSKYHPGFWNNSIDGWWRYFGNPDVAEDLAFMEEFSPINRVDELHGPLLVLGGIRDEITAVQQVRTFQEVAEREGKDVTTAYFPNAGHGVQHWRDRLRRARLIEDFLAEHAGGRSGGFEFVEVAPKFID